MHLDLEAEPTEQAVEVELPPSAKVLTWSGVAEPCPQVGRVLARICREPALELVASAPPERLVDAVHEAELSSPCSAGEGPTRLPESNRRSGEAMSECCLGMRLERDRASGSHSLLIRVAAGAAGAGDMLNSWPGLKPCTTATSAVPTQ